MYDGMSWMPISFSSPSSLSPVNRKPIPALTGEHNFGRVTAISGNYAFVSLGNPSSDDEGSVYVFERTVSGWMQQAKLTPSDAGNEQYFGSSIAIHGNYAVIGTEPIGITTGRAYIFVRDGNTWTEQAILLAPDGVLGDYFGIGVAITTDMVLIGARGKDVLPLTDIGCIYVFKRSGTNWNYSQKIFANATINSDHFGESLAVHDNYLVAGIPRRTYGGATGAGIAQVFFYNGTTWTYQATLTPPSVNINSKFGNSVAIYNNRIAIGQPGLTVSGNVNAGRFSLYLRTGVAWALKQSFTANDAAANDNFGASVGLNDNFLLAGAPDKTDAMHTNVGVVYAYEYDLVLETYVYKRVIKNIDGQNHLDFGRSLKIDLLLNTYIIGSPGKNNNSGQVSFGLME
jgi:hypothetical protein